MLYAMLRLFVAAALPYGVGAIAAEAADLYQAQTIVTGQGEANRIIGFGFCLEDVLIKVSGVQNLAGDSRLAVPKANASNLVRTFRYHDRMTGISTHDEQGTRDRPYDLIVDFSPEKIDDLLDTLGLKAWLAHRPVLGVFAGF